MGDATTINIPASHRSDRYDLPPIMAMVYAGEAPAKSMTAIEGIQEWFKQGSSNLLVLMGGMGSGKTTSLQKISQTWKIKSEFIYFDHIVTLNEGSEISALDRVRLTDGSLVIVDNFDAVNSLAGFQVTPPDLRIVGGLASSHRVILATRRTPESLGDELVRQLKAEIRLSNLGFKNPFVIQLVPWELEQLRTHAVQNNDAALMSLSNLLSAIPAEDTAYLRRPLLITMLLRLGDNLPKVDEPLIVAQIYQQYCETTLSIDYDLKRSRIAGALKHGILSDLAFDIFSGTAPGQEGQAALSVGIDRVSERVLEHVLKETSLRSLSDVNKYDWTEDFLTTGHLFEEVSVSPLSKFADKQFGFTHQSFYEYFVGLAIIKRIVRGHALGLDLEYLSLATVDSLALAFVKELGGSELRSAIKKLVVRPRLTAADRLILHYLLEDDPDFASIIENSPSDYFDALETAQQGANSFLLRKMMRYQLVICGRYAAKDYVSDIKSQEDEKGLRAEQRLHSSEIVVTAQLLQRLKNPALARARYITIYRLGQLGDESAIPSLEMVFALDSSLSEAAKEAIEKIKQRSIKQ